MANIGYSYPLNSFTLTSATGTTTMNLYTNGYNSYVGMDPPPRREPTALEWLTSEIEKTCKLAR